MLRIENIYKTFENSGNTIQVLKGINLHVWPGESYGIIGPSGAGKSTLLNIMGTLEPPSEGNVYFKDLDVYQMDEIGLSKIRNREIGFVFQLHHLLPEFNAEENTMIPALISGLLLADEPTGNLDKATGDEITKLLLSLNKSRGLALIIATHNLELAYKMSKQLQLVDGRF